MDDLGGEGVICFVFSIICLVFSIICSVFSIGISQPEQLVSVSSEMAFANCSFTDPAPWQ